MRYLPCYHPEADGCRGRLQFQVQRSEDLALPLTYVLHCDQCGRRMTAIPGVDTEDYLAHHSETPALDEQSIMGGYLPPAYLAYAGVSPEMLKRIEIRRGVYVTSTPRRAPQLEPAL